MKYDDLKLLLADITAHTKKTSYKVMEDNNPFTLTYGFKCSQTDKKWSISIVKLKQSMDQDEQLKEIIKLLSSNDGRLRLVDAINSDDFEKYMKFKTFW